MSTLDFKIEWEDPGGARGRELRATWSRLEILIGKWNVTQVYDRTLNSIRSGIYGPLYPVAEWVVSNWWTLLHECRVPSRTSDEMYARRHNIRFAAEGFALPWLEIHPTHGGFAMLWRQRALLRERVNFIQEGSSFLDSATVEEALKLFVDRVVSRLEEQGVVGTCLQSDWSSILQQGAEEKSFCDAAGAMGLDPFDISAEDSSKVLRAASALASDILGDFFEAVDVTQFDKQLAWVIDGLKFATSQVVDLKELKNVKQNLTKIGTPSLPWEQGYQTAREFRRLLQIQSKEHINIEELSPNDPIANAIGNSATNQSGFEGISGVNEFGSPGFFIREGNALTQRFAFCRSLYEYLHSSDSASALISSAISDKQKRNRAFAAKLLAPEKLIRERMRRNAIGQSDVEELAGRFEVSTYVITHQIENHHLGRVL